MFRTKTVHFAYIALLLSLAITLTVIADAEEVVLRVAFADAKTPKEELEDMVVQFEEIHPGIRVEIENIYGNNFDKLTTHVIGGVVADLLQMDNETPTLAMQNGFLLNLTPYIERDNAEDLITDFFPHQVARMTQDGKIFGLPMYTAPGAIFCNRRMFAEAGLVEPSGDWDWSEFSQLARKLTRFDGEKVTQAGFHQFLGWTWVFSWFVQGGVDFDDPTEVPLGSAEAIATAEFLNEQVNRGSMYWGWGGDLDFTSQGAAMTFSGSWELKYWIDLGIGFTIAPAPTGPARKATLTQFDTWAIASQTDHPDEAWEFLKWMYSEEVYREYLHRFGLQPSRLSLGNEWIDSIANLYWKHGASKVVGLENFLTCSDYATPPPLFADTVAINQYIMPALNDIMRANKPIASTLKSMSEAATNFLRKNK